jgi:hypothetical protein
MEVRIDKGSETEKQEITKIRQISKETSNHSRMINIPASYLEALASNLSQMKTGDYCQFLQQMTG